LLGAGSLWLDYKNAKFRRGHDVSLSTNASFKPDDRIVIDVNRATKVAVRSFYRQQSTQYEDLMQHAQG